MVMSYSRPPAMRGPISQVRPEMEFCAPLLTGPSRAMDPSLDFLERLFGADGRPAVGNTGVKLRVVRRAGHPFLLLPRHPREAVATLSLYAPQTIRARLARALLRWPIQISVP